MADTFMGAKTRHPLLHAAAAHALTVAVSCTGSVWGTITYMQKRLDDQGAQLGSQNDRIVALENKSHEFDADKAYRAERINLIEQRQAAQAQRDTEALRTLSEINIKVSRIEGRMEERDKSGEHR